MTQSSAAVIDETTVRACLARQWDLPDAKAVARTLRAPFAGGLSVAAILDAEGIAVGRPCRHATAGPSSTSTPVPWPS